MPLCLCKTSCRVTEVFWVVARALPVCPCAGCFDKHDISCHLVHNIYIELSHTELRQKSPITHSLPSVVYTTKAFYLWSCFVQALEGITIHCVTRLSVVFNCSIFVLCQQKGQWKDVHDFQNVLFIHIRRSNKKFYYYIIYIFTTITLVRGQHGGAWQFCVGVRLFTEC